MHAYTHFTCQLICCTAMLEEASCISCMDEIYGFKFRIIEKLQTYKVKISSILHAYCIHICFVSIFVNTAQFDACWRLSYHNTQSSTYVAVTDCFLFYYGHLNKIIKIGWKLYIYVF
jgi:hypothetical protein